MKNREVVIKSEPSYNNDDKYAIYLEENCDCDNELGFTTINNYICGGLNINEAKVAKFGISNYISFIETEELFNNRKEYLTANKLKLNSMIIIKNNVGKEYVAKIIDFELKNQNKEFIRVQVNGEEFNIEPSVIVKVEDNNER